MPMAQVTIYLNEDNLKIYVKDKEKYNKIARDALKKSIENDKKRLNKLTEEI